MKYLIFCMVLAGSIQLYSQTPETLSFQGVLTDSDGEQLPDDSYELEFRLYDAATGGQLIWQEMNTVETKGGVFSTVLGTNTALDIPFDRAYWLGIAVDGSAELEPRTALTAVPYAMNGNVSFQAGEDLAVRDANGDTTFIMRANGRSWQKGPAAYQSGMFVKMAGDSILYMTGRDGWMYIGSDTLSERSGMGSEESILSVDVLIATSNKLAIWARSSLSSAILGESTSGPGIVGESQNSFGVRGHSIEHAGVVGSSVNSIGLLGQAGVEPGVYGSSSSGAGVYGISEQSYGISGFSEVFPGVRGESINQAGVFGTSTLFPGVQGKSINDAGVHAVSETDFGLEAEGGEGAALLKGDVQITENGMLMIDNVPESSSEKILVWDADKYVKWRALSDIGTFDGTLIDIPLTVEDSEGISTLIVDPISGTTSIYGEALFFGETGFGGTSTFLDDVVIEQGNFIMKDFNGDTTFMVLPDGTSFHKGLETFDGGLRVRTTSGSWVMNVSSDPSATFPVLIIGNTEMSGNLEVHGDITANSKSFLIDHPLDPKHKTLRHYSTESHEMLNVYSGNAILDSNGKAVIRLPDWFEALNTDFRYQLTCIGGFANVYIAQKIEDNNFHIAGGTEGLEVSWMVTGVRHDHWARENQLPVVEHKVK